MHVVLPVLHFTTTNNQYDVLIETEKSLISHHWWRGGNVLRSAVAAI